MNNLKKNLNFLHFLFPQKVKTVFKTKKEAFCKK